MKLDTFSIKINPKQPVKQYGHIQQVNEIFKFHDDLYARFLIIEDDFLFIHISTDTLGFNLAFQNELTNNLIKIHNKDIKLVISSTHTHYGGDTNDETYYKQLLNDFTNALTNLNLKEYDNLQFSYKWIYYDEIGKSRITNHKGIVVLALIEILHNNQVLATIINHNTHPTILSGSDTDFFSSEFCGYVLKKLSNNFKNEFFTYTSGCMGDISTRFTRSSQDYNSVIKLGDKLYNKIIELKNDKSLKQDIKMFYEEIIIPVNHSFKDIEINTTNLTPRELETIEYGKIVRKNLQNNPDLLMKEIKISNLSFNNFNIIFIPNELFSDYLSYINLDKTIIACYSNGYGPYMLPLNKKIFTYELFTDTFSTNSKIKVINQLKKWNSV